MIAIQVDNSICRITGLTRGQLGGLRKKISYWIDGKPKTKWKTVKVNGKNRRVAERVATLKRVSLVEKDGRFPTGNLTRVKRWLRDSKLQFGTKDLRVKPKTFTLGKPTLLRADYPYTPYAEQVEAAEAAADPANEGRGILVAPTGFGKSMVDAMVLDSFQVPSLIVVPRVGLKKQLIADLRRMFPPELVGPLVNGKRKYFFTVENLDQLDPDVPIEDIDLVLLEEFHHSGALTYRTLNEKAWAGVYFKFGVTATPFRSDSNEKLLLESVLSEVIYRVPHDLAVEKGYIVPFEAYFLDLPPVKVTGDNPKFATVYRQLVVERDDKNEMTAKIAARLIELGLSTLILVKQVDHGHEIEDQLAGLGCLVPYAKGENDDNEPYFKAFNRLEETGLIGTTGVAGEGRDTKPCEWVVLATTVKSRVLFMQCAGRAARVFTYPDGRKKESGKILLFRDPSHPWTLSHFEACVQYLLEEYGVSCQKLELDL